MRFAMTNSPAIGFVRQGRNWTLATAFGELLYLAEQSYGRRNRDWTPIGIEFHEGADPCIWYPEPTERKYVCIALGSGARDDASEAVFQLAHEVIHVLSPTGGSHASVMEEGLATLFSLEISRDNSPAKAYRAAYLPAAYAVRKLLDHNPDAIKQLRLAEPEFRKITSEQILREFPGFDPTIARQLCEKWVNTSASSL